MIVVARVVDINRDRWLREALDQSRPRVIPKEDRPFFFFWLHSGILYNGADKTDIHRVNDRKGLNTSEYNRIDLC